MSLRDGTLFFQGERHTSIYDRLGMSYARHD